MGVQRIVRVGVWRSMVSMGSNARPLVLCVCVCLQRCHVEGLLGWGRRACVGVAIAGVVGGGGGGGGWGGGGMVGEDRTSSYARAADTSSE
jgi:hypothetical protein